VREISEPGNTGTRAMCPYSKEIFMGYESRVDGYLDAENS